MQYLTKCIIGKIKTRFVLVNADSEAMAKYEADKFVRYAMGLSIHNRVDIEVVGFGYHDLKVSKFVPPSFTFPVPVEEPSMDNLLASLVKPEEVKVKKIEAKASNNGWGRTFSNTVVFKEASFDMVGTVSHGARKTKKKGGKGKKAA